MSHHHRRDWERPYRRHYHFFWPIILIGFGVLFLVDNLGLLPWGVGGTIARFWPLFLIIIGLDILFGSFFRFSPRSWTQSGSRETISQPLNGATQAVVNLETGVYRLRIGALANSEQLVEGSVSLGGNEQLEQNFRQDGTTAIVDLRTHGWGGCFDWGRDRTWELQFNPEVTIRFRINAGVGEAFLDLAQLKVSDLNLHAGVGRVDLTLPGMGRMKGKIDGGVGEIRVDIPKSMAARIKAETGIGSFNVQGNYQFQGAYRISPNFETAENQADLDIHGGVGQITVREI
ncbi:MAG TPA: DUF5668 domain-containing protein [Bacillota bacterium]|nr:DUF5668 domain-containing protein [Bacillota bacterium]